MGDLGQEEGVWLTSRQDLVLGSCRSPLPAPLPPVLSACVTHTDGNNFFQLLGAGRGLQPAPPGRLSRAPAGPVLAAQTPPSFLLPSQQHFFSCICLPSWMDSCLLKSCVSVSLSSVLVLPCDGNVLVNCITNLLRVYVCLWG